MPVKALVEVEAVINEEAVFHSSLISQIVSFF